MASFDPMTVSAEMLHEQEETSTGTEFYVGGSAVFNFEIKNKDVSKY